MIELERESMCGDPEREVTVWLAKLSEVDRKRSGFQDMAAEGLITFDELRAKLASLEEIRETAERELEALGARREHLERLERDVETLLETYARMAPEALETLTPEERHTLYKMLRLRVLVHVDGTMEIGGTFVENLKVSEPEAIYSIITFRKAPHFILMSTSLQIAGASDHNLSLSGGMGEKRRKVLKRL